VQVDGGWPFVAGAGWFAGFFDSVLVVAGAFHGSGAGAFGALRDEQGGDLVQVGG